MPRTAQRSVSQPISWTPSCQDLLPFFGVQRRARLVLERKGSPPGCQPRFELHHRPHIPRHELALTVSVPLALALRSRRRVEDEAKELLGDLVYARCAVGDLAAVQVNVLFLLH